MTEPYLGSSAQTICSFAASQISCIAPSSRGWHVRTVCSEPGALGTASGVGEGASSSSLLLWRILSGRAQDGLLGSDSWAGDGNTEIQQYFQNVLQVTE